MSELQLGLIILGLVVVTGVYLYNRLQERRFRRETGAGLEGNFDDVLLRDGGAERVEPSLDPAGVPEAAGAPAAAVAATPVAVPVEPYDDAIQFVAAVHADSPIPAEDIAAAVQAAARIGRAVSWAGREAPGGGWLSLAGANAHAFREVWAGMLLADRSGPLSKGQIEALREVLARLAQGRGASLQWPDTAAALEAAQRLDAFCAEVDVQVGLNLVPADRQAIAATRVRGLAEASGFRLDDDGVFRYLEEESGRTLFSLRNQGQEALLPAQVKQMKVQGMTMLLDVAPQADGLAAFDRMVAMARSLATALGWVMVDDRQAPLGDAAIAKIRSSLEALYARMAAEGIPAGSPRALRLFA